ncbi:hypothetical protein D3C71_2176460 [compost metagenome]
MVTFTPGKTSAARLALERLMTVSALAMMNASNPGLPFSRARATACAPSLPSMYPHRFHLRSLASASNDGNCS